MFEKKIEEIVNLFFNFLYIFTHDHMIDSTEIQFHADFPLISCGEKKIGKKIEKMIEKKIEIFFNLFFDLFFNLIFDLFFNHYTWT